jgi:glycerol-3-phosphate dehydrogenase
LVRKSLLERERLLARNPHLMQPLRLVLPHDAAQRPRWLLRAGLFLYDHLAPRRVSAASHAMALPGTPEGEALQARFTHAMVYSDGWVDDARLVLACALDARAHGARILTRHACVHARLDGAHWRVTLREPDGREHTVQARALVNATGPWAQRFLAEAVQQSDPPRLRLVQGTHLVIDRRWTHDAGYLLQNPDGRVLFALPFQQDFTLLGTTDLEVSQHDARVTPAEVDYLCTQASRWLREPVRPADVRHAWAGIRPLLDDAQGQAQAQAITRDYRLDWVAPAGQAPRLDVWGGKLTTFRRLAEEAADRLSAHFAAQRDPAVRAHRGAWTAEASLPGGDCGPLDAFIARLQREHPDRDPALIARWARAHGSTARALLHAPPGREIAPGVCEAELRHAHAHEWAQTADDFLWRRSKLGLHLAPAEQARIRDWFDEARAFSAPAPR